MKKLLLFLFVFLSCGKNIVAMNESQDNRVRPSRYSKYSNGSEPVNVPPRADGRKRRVKYSFDDKNNWLERFIRDSDLSISSDSYSDLSIFSED